MLSPTELYSQSRSPPPILLLYLRGSLYTAQAGLKLTPRPSIGLVRPCHILQKSGITGLALWLFFERTVGGEVVKMWKLQTQGHEPQAWAL